MTRSRFTLAVALLALAGCTVLDDRPSIRLELVGPASVISTVTVRVSGRTSETATLLLDGEPFDSVIMGEARSVLLPSSLRGTHDLQAVYYEGAYPARSNVVQVSALRDPRYTVTPAPSDRLMAAGPFRVTVTLSWPAIDLDPYFAPAALHVLGSEALVPTTLEVSDDGRSLTLTTEEPLSAFDPGLVLRLNLHDRLMQPFLPAGDVPSVWRAPTVDLALTSPAGDVTTAAGQLTVAVAVPGSSLASSLSGTIGGVRFTLTPPTWTTQVDLRSLPEGRHALVVEPGYRAVPGPGTRSVTIDRTPPTLTCEPALWTPADLADGGRIRLDFSEPPPLGVCSVRVGGELVLSQVSGFFGSFAEVEWIRAGQPVPTVVEVACDTPDAAGLLPAPCRLPLPTWSQAMGSPVLSMGPSAAVPSLSGAHAQVFFGPDPRWVVSDPTSVWSGGLQVSFPTLASSSTGLDIAAILIADDVLALWLEEDAGLRQVARAQRLATGPNPPEPFTLSRTVGGSAHDPAIDPAAGTLAWIEDQPAGGQALYLADQANALVGGAPVVESPSPLHRPSVFSGQVAFLDGDAGAPAHLRVRALQAGAWSDLGGPLNADPQVDAASPAMAGTDVVAWEEAGRILARQRDPVTGWSAPVVVAGDATSPARLPVPAGLTVAGGEFLPGLAFIERVGARDRVRYARLSVGRWTVLPDLVSGSFAGEIREVSASPRVARGRSALSVTWIDTFGSIYAARLNE